MEAGFVHCTSLTMTYELIFRKFYLQAYLQSDI